jgi:hypothetical protein
VYVRKLIVLKIKARYKPAPRVISAREQQQRLEKEACPRYI